MASDVYFGTGGPFEPTLESPFVDERRDAVAWDDESAWPAGPAADDPWDDDVGRDLADEEEGLCASEAEWGHGRADDTGPRRGPTEHERSTHEHDRDALPGSEPSREAFEAQLDTEAELGLRSILETAWLAMAIAQGDRDVDSLTNRLFFRRHPERDGRRLRRDEPDFHALAAEWRRIRDAVVRPYLARLARTATASPRPGGRPVAGAGDEADGRSTVARPADRMWTGRLRPEGWRRGVFGLVVHQSGGKRPCTAVSEGRDPFVDLLTYYRGSRGTHYVCGWGGVAGGQLVQIADDRYQAAGVGMKQQRDSVCRGRWEDDLSPSTVAAWRRRWPGRTSPVDLLPGTTTANAPYVHVEMVPAIVSWCDRLRSPGPGRAPLRSGLHYTQAQHDAIAALAVDIAQRHRWPDRWWETSRLLGHEDLSPISRQTSRGGWDPGALRPDPWFDWDYVLTAIRSRLA